MKTIITFLIENRVDIGKTVLIVGGILLFMKACGANFD